MIWPDNPLPVRFVTVIRMAGLRGRGLGVCVGTVADETAARADDAVAVTYSFCPVHAARAGASAGSHCAWIALIAGLLVAAAYVTYGLWQRISW